MRARWWTTDGKGVEFVFIIMGCCTKVNGNGIKNMGTGNS
jgi:hypothetical protein